MNSSGQFTEIWCRIDTARKDPLLKRFVLHPLPPKHYRLVLPHQIGLLTLLLVSSSMSKQQHLKCFAGYISAFVYSHNTSLFLPTLTASFPFNRVCAASLFWVNILCAFWKKPVSLVLKKAAWISKLQVLIGWSPTAEILHDFQQHLPHRGGYKGLHYADYTSSPLMTPGRSRRVWRQNNELITLVFPEINLARNILRWKLLVVRYTSHQIRKWSGNKHKCQGKTPCNQ